MVGITKFAKIYNTTPGKWLMKKRLNLARELMFITDYTIQQICYDCGFESETISRRIHG